MDAYRKRIIAAGASGRQAEPATGEIDNHAKAAEILELVQRTAEEVIGIARSEADETLGRARSETEAILKKAIRQAEQITGDARARAEGLQRDAEERHRQAMGSLVQTREELERRVDDLRAFEREYRTRLRAFVEGQFKDLWSGEMRPQAEHAIEELRKAAASEGQRVSAVLLREDGTYDVLDFGRAGEDEAQAQEEPPAHRDTPRYTAPVVTDADRARGGNIRRQEEPPPYSPPQVTREGDSP